MSQILKIANFSARNLRETGVLDADQAATGSPVSLLIQNSQDFSSSDIVMIGTLGSEKAEKKSISSVADATHITVPSLSFAHLRGETITKLFGDQIKIYRAANVDGSVPADSAFGAAYATINIDTDQEQTIYTDATGSSSYWYKSTYYNSVSTSESALSDATAVRGGSGESITYDYATLEGIRQEAGLTNNKWITDEQIRAKQTAAQSYIDASLVGRYVVPFTAPFNPLIVEITKKLAAGYLLVDDYGPTQTLDTRQGQAKIDYVTNAQKTGVLDKIVARQLSLTDVKGNETVVTDSGSFDMWPDSTTGTDMTDPDNGAPRMFSTQQRY
jgi:hypothetical protein